MTTETKKERQRSAWALEKAAYGKIAKLRHEIESAEIAAAVSKSRHETRIAGLRESLAAAEAALGALKVPESAPAPVRPS